MFFRKTAYVWVCLFVSLYLMACQPTPAENPVITLPTLASLAVVPTTDSASAPLPTPLSPTPTTSAVVAQPTALSLSTTPLPTAASVIVPTPVGFVPTATAVVWPTATPKPPTSDSSTSSHSGTASYSGSLDLPPLPTISPEYYEQFINSSLLWMDNLKTCNFFVISLPSPFFDLQQTNTILGWEGDVCLTQMVNEMATVECRFTQEAINVLTREELYEELREGRIHISSSDPSNKFLNEQCVTTVLNYSRP